MIPKEEFFESSMNLVHVQDINLSLSNFFRFSGVDQSKCSILTILELCPLNYKLDMLENSSFNKWSIISDVKCKREMIRKRYKMTGNI